MRRSHRSIPAVVQALGVALVLILYTYGGWNDAAFVAAEVRNGKKNITRALLLGIQGPRSERPAQRPRRAGRLARPRSHQR